MGRIARTADADFADGADGHGSDSSVDGGLLFRKTTNAILGGFYSVYNSLGFGFLESVYTNALIICLTRAGLRVDQQTPFEVFFRNQSIGVYRADLVVESTVIVEIKAARTIIPQHLFQLRNYLRASNLRVGLLLNFGEKPQFRRVVWTRSNPR